MSKPDTPKRDRKARREALRRQAKEWAKVPTEAASGPCTSPTCTLPKCLNPWSTEVKLHNVEHTGTLVLLCYSVYIDDGKDTERRLRINGEDIAVVPKGSLLRENPAEHQAQTRKLIETVQSRFGAGSMLVVLQHMERGRHLYQTHHDRGQA